MTLKKIVYGNMYQHKYSKNQVETLCSNEVEPKDDFIKSVNNDSIACVEYIDLKKGEWHIMTLDDFCKYFEEVK